MAEGSENDPVNTPSNELRLPTPACWPFPWAMIVVQEPSFCGTTSVKGRVSWSTPVALVQFTAPDGGLKSTMGKGWSKTGVSPGAAGMDPGSVGFVKN